MRELIIIDLCGTDYGVWRDEISETLEVNSIHRLPLIPSYIAGMVIVEHRTVTVADLSVCMGLTPASTLGKSNIFIMTNMSEISGFAVGCKAVNISIPDFAVLPMPSFLKTNMIQSAVVVEQNLIPIIEISELLRTVLTDGITRSAFKSACFSQTLASNGDLRLFTSNEEIFALPSAGLNNSIVRLERLTKVASAPDYVKGIMLYDGKIMPVFSVSEMMTRKGPVMEDVVIPVEIGEELIGLLVGSDEGILGKDCKIMQIPKLARHDWIKSAAVHGREIIPIIDVLELISRHSEGEEDDGLVETYSSSSSFETVFGTKDVEVIEFSIFGMCYSLPKSEVQGIIGIKSFRALPLTKSIVVGVSEYDGELLPVLDPGLCFARRSEIEADWKMIVVTNGNFRGLVVTEQIFDSKLVDVANERQLPIILPHDIVYGCYIEASDVRVILNIEAMAVCIDWTSIVDIRKPNNLMVPQGFTPSQIPGVENQDGDGIERSIQDIYPIPTPPIPFKEMEFSDEQDSGQAANSSIVKDWESLEHAFKHEMDEIPSIPEGDLGQEEGESEGVAEAKQLIPPMSTTEAGKEAAQETFHDSLMEGAAYQGQKESSPDFSNFEPTIEVGNLDIESVETKKRILLPKEWEKYALNVENEGVNQQEVGIEEPHLTSEETQESQEGNTVIAGKTAAISEISALEAGELHAEPKPLKSEETAIFKTVPVMPDTVEAYIPEKHETLADILSAEENTSGIKPPYQPLDESVPAGPAPIDEAGIFHEELYAEKHAEMERTEEVLSEFALKDGRPDEEVREQPEPENVEQLILTPYVNPYYKRTDEIDATSRNAAASDVKLDPAALRKILQGDVKEIENPKILSNETKNRLVHGVIALILLLGTIYLLFGHNVKPEVQKTPIRVEVEKPVEIKQEAAIPPKQPEGLKVPEQPEIKKAPAPDPVIKEKTAPEKILPENKTEKAQVLQLLKIAPDKIFKDGIYLVKPGDTLWDISERFTGDPSNYSEVAERNSIEDPNMIFPGQKINVPKKDK